MIQDSLIALLHEKDLYQISVRELCAKAQVNRTTFYKYYNSPIDLLKEIDSDYRDTILRIFQNTDTHLSLENFLCYIKEHRNLTLIVTSSQTHSLLQNDDNFLADILIQMHPGEDDPDKYQYISQFYGCGTIALLREWLTKSNPEPPSYIAKMIRNLCHYQEH